MAMRRLRGSDVSDAHVVSRRHVAVVVPEADDRFIAGMLVAQDAERRGAQIEQPAVGRRQAQPASGQDPEEMAVTEEEHAAAQARAAGR